jgi:hypothetical protein
MAKWPGSGQNDRDPAGYDKIRPLIWPDPEESGQTYLSESGNGDRTLPDSGSICQTLFFAFRNFFYASQTLKNIFEKIIFSENDFAENILRRKSFYVETNGV